jgi:hypothetical protein
VEWLGVREVGGDGPWLAALLGRRCGSYRRACLMTGLGGFGTVRFRASPAT